MTTLKNILDGIDLIAARMRGPLQTLFGLGLAFQGLVISGQIKLPPGAKWSNIAAIASMVLAFFTMRTGQVTAIKTATKDEAVEAVVGAVKAIDTAKDASKP